MTHQQRAKRSIIRAIASRARAIAGDVTGNSLQFSPSYSSMKVSDSYRRNSLTRESMVSLSEILLSGGSCAVDSIFAAMSSHDEKLKTLEGKLSAESSACYGAAWWRQENKNYRGVRQRQWGKWVPEIRLPQNRARV